MTDLTKYVRTPTIAQGDLRNFLNTELAKIQAATDTFFKMLGDANMLLGSIEGDFLATVTGSTTAGVATYTTQKGRFIKIGRLVAFALNVSWSGHTGTGNMFISGMPFAADVLAPSTPVQLLPVAGPPATAIGLMNNSQISIQTAGGAAPQAMTAAGDMRVMGVYFAAS